MDEYSGDNHIISTFINRQKQRIKRTYKTKDIGHVWKREKEKAKKQHYHVYLIIDGDVIQNPLKKLEQLPVNDSNDKTIKKILLLSF